MPPDNEDLIIRVKLEDLTEQEFKNIKRRLKELNKLSGSSEAVQASKERTQRLKTEEAQIKANMSANTQAEQTKRKEIESTKSANKAASDERIQAGKENEAIIKQNTKIQDNQAKQQLQNTRAQTAADSLSHRIRQQDEKETHNAWNRNFQDRREKRQREALDERIANRQSREAMSRMGSSGRRLSRIFGSWKGLLAEAGEYLATEFLQALGQVARRAFEVTRNMEQLRLGLAAFEGSQGRADRHIADLRELAKLPQVQREGVIRQFLGLRGAGLEADFSKELIREMSNLTAIAGKTAHDTNRMLYFTQQLVGLQQFRNEEIRQQIEIAPGFRRNLVQTFGTSQGEQIMDFLRANNMTFMEGFRKLVENMEKNVRAPTDTIANAMENLKDSFDDLLLLLGNTFMPTIKTSINVLSESIESLTTIFTILEPIFRDIQSLIGHIFDVESLIFERPTTASGRVEQLRKEDNVIQAQKTFVYDFLKTLSKIPHPMITPQLRDYLNQIEKDDIPHLMEEISKRNQPRNAYLYPQARFEELETDRKLIEDTLKSWNQAFKNLDSSLISSPDFEKNLKAVDPIFTELDKLLKPFQEALRINEARLEELSTEWHETDKTTEEGKRRIRQLELEGNAIVKVNQQIKQYISDKREEATIIRQGVQDAIKWRMHKGYNFGVAPDAATRPGGIEGGRTVDDFPISGGRYEPYVLPHLRGADRLRPTDEVHGYNLADRILKKWEITDRKEALPEYSRNVVPDGLGFFPQRTRSYIGTGRKFNIIGIGEVEVHRLVQNETGMAGMSVIPDVNRRLALRAEQAQEKYGTMSPLEQRIYGDPSLGLSPSIPRPVPDITPIDISQAAPALADPQIVRGQIESARRLLKQWESIKKEVTDYADALQKTSLFKPLDQNDYLATFNILQGLNKDIAKLEEAKKSLEGFTDIPEEMIGPYQRALTLVNSGLEQLRKQADRLNDSLEHTNMLMRFELYGQNIQGSFNRLLQPILGRRGGRSGVRAFGRQFGEFFNRYNAPAGRAIMRDQQLERREMLEGRISSAGSSLYNQFVAPSLLDLIGIGSSQSRSKERALEDLKRSIQNAQKEVRESEILNANQQAEQLLEIDREYQEEKRSIERQYEQDRKDAWNDWVRQQLTDFPRLIAEQLNLQLAARTTDWILSSFGGGGGGGFNLGSLFGGGGNQQVSPFQNIMNLFKGGGGQASAASGGGLGASAATVGTVASVALAGHNIITGIRDGLYDDLGKDAKNIFSDVHNALGGGDEQNLYLVKGNVNVDVGVEGTRAISHTFDELMEDSRI